MLGPAPSPLCYPLPALGPHLPLSRLTLSPKMSHRETPCHRQPPPPSPRRLSAANYWAAKRFFLAEKTVKEVPCLVPLGYLGYLPVGCASAAAEDSQGVCWESKPRRRMRSIIPEERPGSSIKSTLARLNSYNYKGHVRLPGVRTVNAFGARIQSAQRLVDRHLDILSDG